MEKKNKKIKNKIEDLFGLISTGYPFLMFQRVPNRNSQHIVFSI